MTSSSDEALPGTGIDAGGVLAGFRQIVHDLAPKNRALLAKRDALQDQIDAWHRDNGAPSDLAAYQAFLKEIGYLAAGRPGLHRSRPTMSTRRSPTVAGPQLVVPVMNARYALNAANARWGSLYDALYGTDAIPETDGAEKGKGYNPERGAKVVAWAKNFLDEARRSTAPAGRRSTGFAVDGAALALTASGQRLKLRDPGQFAGYRGDASQSRRQSCSSNNGLHIEILIDRDSPIGKYRSGAASPTSSLESALTTIQDCEDSIAAVDAEDKVVVYRNWLGLMKGDLAEEITKGGKTFTRRLNPDRATPRRTAAR